jgi:DNA polymerase III epsilon subunit-like protein
VVQEGKGGHDSLEDARACRELVHALVGQIPG